MMKKTYVSSFFTFQQTQTPDSRQSKSHDQLHDRGQYPRRSLPEITPEQLGTGFRDFLNLESSTSPSKTGYLEQGESLITDEKPLSILDTSLSWPSPDSSFLQSGSPITVGFPSKETDIESEVKDIRLSPSLSPRITRNRQPRPSSAHVRAESPSPQRGRSARSSSARVRERSWSPPSFKDTSLDIPYPKGCSGLRDTDSFSLPDIPGKSHRESNSKWSGHVSHSSRPSAITITVSSASSLTDTSSTVTSTAPPSNRETEVLFSDRKRLPRGYSPPVRDSGSSLTTVTSLTEQQLPDSARDRRLSFDIGFVDILTVDSNSSVVDQLSSGRVSSPVVSDLLFFVVMGKTQNFSNKGQGHWKQYKF